MRTKYPACIAFLFLLLSVCGCEITQPGSFYDKSADNPPLIDLYVTGLQPNQHIVDTVTVTFSFISSTDSVKEAYVYIDDVYKHTLTANHYTYYLYPSSLSSGKHTLKVYVVAANKGLYSAVGVSQLLYNIPFYYDTDPPANVVANPAVFKNNQPYLTWNKSTDPNFKCYIIHYTNRYGKSVSYSISDRDKTEYTDTSTSLIYGRNIVLYTIYVSNGVKVSTGTFINFSWGTELPNGNMDQYCINNTNNLFYFIQGNVLSVISTQSNTLIKTVTLDQVPTGILKYLYLNPDDSKLYVLCPISYPGTTTIYVCDSRTIAPLQVIKTTAAGASRMVATNDRLYLVNSDKMYIINSSDGSLISSLAVANESVSKVFIDDPAKLLYTIAFDKTTQYDVSGDSIKTVKSVQKGSNIWTPSGPAYYNNKIYLIDGYHSFTAIDSRTLTVVKNYTFSNTYNDVTDLCVSNGNLFVGEEGYSGISHGTVYRFSADDLSLKETILFTDNIKNTSASPDGKFLYADMFRNNAWAVWIAVPLNN